MKYLILLVLLASCTKDQVYPKSYQMNSAYFHITKNNGDTSTLFLKDWIDFNVVKGDLLLTPNNECRFSYENCQGVKAIDVFSVSIFNNKQYNCK